jgi:hypothetical protein
MTCGTAITRIDTRGYQLWYNIRTGNKITGHNCAKCYDKLRRLPLFQNFKEKLKQRICSNCGSNKTLFHLARGKYPYNKWYKDGKGGFWCNSCYHKITDDPNMTKQYNSTRMKFKDKIIHIGRNPRTGICQWCGRKGLTQMHHKQYHDDEPLRDTVELCPSCHMKESRRNRKAA